MRWDKRCFTFKKVREMLEEDIETPKQCIRILQELEVCCDGMTPNDAQNWEFYEDFRDLKSEIHEDIDFMNEDGDYNSCRVVVDSWLEEFYDLCDAARVWLGL